jgi:hypothetical protein
MSYNVNDDLEGFEWRTDDGRSEKASGGLHGRHAFGVALLGFMDGTGNGMEIQYIIRSTERDL